MNLQKLLFPLIALVLEGCVSDGIERGMAPQPDNQKSAVYVYRNPGASGAFFKSKVSVDEKNIASLSMKAYTWFYLEAGEHKISATFGLGPELSIPINIEDNHSYYIRIDSSSVSGDEKDLANILLTYTNKHTYDKGKNPSTKEDIINTSAKRFQGNVMSISNVTQDFSDKESLNYKYEKPISQ